MILGHITAKAEGTVVRTIPTAQSQSHACMCMTEYEAQFHRKLLLWCCHVRLCN